MAEALRGAKVRFVPVHESRILVQRGPDGWSAAFATAMDLGRLPALAAEPVLLGRFDDCIYFAIEVASPDPVQALFTTGSVRFEDLRNAGGTRFWNSSPACSRMRAPCSTGAAVTVTVARAVRQLALPAPGTS